MPANIVDCGKAVDSAKISLCCSEMLWNYKQKLKNTKEKIIWLTLKKTCNFVPFTVK